MTTKTTKESNYGTELLKDKLKSIVELTNSSSKDNITTLSKLLKENRVLKHQLEEAKLSEKIMKMVSYI